MINRRELVRALIRRNVTDWVVIERAQELGIADQPRAVRRTEQRTRVTVIVHQDMPAGRGSARLELAAHDGSALELVDQAVALATAAVAPAWNSVPSAAPAKVGVLDPALAKAELDQAAAAILGAIRRPSSAEVSTRVEVLREHVAVQTHAGFTARWVASAIRAEALVATPERSLAVTREARRIEDLELAAAIATAASELEQLATAGPLAAGPCSVILGTDALLHGDGHGVWSVFVAQADAALERQGLTRYRLGAPVAPDADRVDEPLTIISDGALDFATRSAPVGDDGDAVRRFAVIERGVCVGLGLTAREAARRHRDPNGGIRNLVVVPGTWRDSVPSSRTIEVRRLRGLAIDPYTGDASLELALALDHQGGHQRAFTGGTIRLDLVAALARARRSSKLVRRGCYHGPASLLIDDVALIA